VPGDPTVLGLPEDVFPVRSAMAVPLIGREGVIGCLVAANRIDIPSFSEEDQSVAETIAIMAAAAYENAALRDELERNAARLVTEGAERRRAEGRHVASESRYRDLFERSLAAVFRGTPHGEILECNEACSELLGFGPGEERLACAHLEHALHELDGGDIYEKLHRSEQGVSTELSLTSRSGAALHVIARLSMVPDGTGGVAMVQGIMLDATERKHREERARGTRSMEAVRRLCAGAAEELETLMRRLTSVGHGAPERAVAPAGNGVAIRTARRETGRRRAREILTLAGRAGELARLFQVLGPRRALAPRIVALDTLLSDLERALPRLIGSKVQMATHRGPHTASLRADPWDLEQILLEFARNASEAMPDGGRLTIRVERQVVGPEDALRWGLLQGGVHLLLAVSDTGTGMDAETRARAFEPFFSTRGAGRGLGLATAYAIAERSGGSIDIESRPGEGTTVRV
jgi:two-component system cell cycle sensor histidine kinase/response regulator CckA